MSLAVPSAGRDLGARVAVRHGLFGVVPGLLTAVVVYRMYAAGNAAVDFQHSFWVAGWRVLHGLSPYHWSEAQVAGGASFPYPAPAALLLAPFGLVSSVSAGVVVTLLCLAAAPASLYVLGIRDWRVYGAAALWAPVVLAWQTANFTLPLLFGATLAWRFRERSWVVATLVACLVSLKPIMAPLWLWLLLARRWRAAAAALLLGAGLNAVSWTLLGWSQLSPWLHLLSRQGKLRDGTGYSLISLADHLGLGSRVGAGLMLVLGGALVAVAVASFRAGGELRALASAGLLTIVLSPQIDAHYLALLLLPLALVRPRLAWPWLAPLALWACPATGAGLWQILLWWAVLAALAREVLMPRPTTGVRRVSPATIGMTA